MRSSEHTAVTYFERPVTPSIYPSPLHDLKREEVPGSFAEPRGVEEPEIDPQSLQIKARSRRPAAPDPITVQPAANVPLPPPSTETFAMMVGGTQHLDQVAYKDPLPTETGQCR